MREEYDIKALNPRKNPYVTSPKKQVTIPLDENVIAFFENQSASIGIPRGTLNSILKQAGLK